MLFIFPSYNGQNSKQIINSALLHITLKTANMGYDVNVIQRRWNSCNVNITYKTQTHHGAEHWEL